MKNVPVFAVPVGSSTRLPDLELLSLDAPTFGVNGKSVRVPFTIESSLPRETSAVISLKSTDGDEVTKDLRIAPMGRTSDALIWKPKAPGDYTLTLTVPKQADETIAQRLAVRGRPSVPDEPLSWGLTRFT